MLQTTPTVGLATPRRLDVGLDVVDACVSKAFRALETDGGF
jgi:hypothetical protein